MTTETRKRRNYTEDFKRDAVALVTGGRLLYGTVVTGRQMLACFSCEHPPQLFPVSLGRIADSVTQVQRDY